MVLPWLPGLAALCLAAAVLPARAAAVADPSCGLVYNAPTCVGVRSATKLTAVPLPLTAPAVDEWSYTFGPGGGEVVLASHPAPGVWASALVLQAPEAVVAAHALQAGGRGAQAATRADLRGGRLGLRFSNAAGAGAPAGEFVEVGLYDVLSFDVPAGLGSFNLVVDMALHGQISARDSFGLPLLTAGVDLVGTGATRVAPVQGADFVALDSGTFNLMQRFQAQVLAPADAGMPWVATVALAATMKSQPFGTAVYDINFYNTATLNLVLPDGVAMRSASGVFLTPVPEPGTAGLALAGLALLLLLRQVRRTPQTTRQAP